MYLKYFGHIARKIDAMGKIIISEKVNGWRSRGRSPGFEFSHYIFGCSKPWSSLTKAERHQAIDWELWNAMEWWNGSIQHGCMECRSLIAKAVMSAAMTDDEIVVYVKRHEKWKARQEVYVENIALRRHRISKLDVLRCL